MAVPLSVLDLALVSKGQSPREALEGCVAYAQRAEALGYRRIWYAEHHNIEHIAASATSVLIAHVAAHTARIRVGAGGIMLPNHRPLVIAEQFGTLESLHPGRIDLGLGRAPGTDPATLHALGVAPSAAASFPDQVLELRGYLGDESPVVGVSAVPGKGSHVPLYILSSSAFGAALAARLGLPYAFASHFAPGSLEQSVASYRSEFRPSAQLEEPYVIAGVNVIAADTHAEAEEQFATMCRTRLRALFTGGKDWSDEQAQQFLESPLGESVRNMTKYSAVGTRSEVQAYIERFASLAGADELIVLHAAPTPKARLHSLELLASPADA